MNLKIISLLKKFIFTTNLLKMNKKIILKYLIILKQYFSKIISYKVNIIYLKLILIK